MVDGHSIVYHYAIVTVKLGLVLLVGLVAIAIVWAYWVRNR